MTHSHLLSGRKKLRGVETELLRLAAIEQENLVKIYAVKVTNPSSDESSRLSILMEQRPPVSLRHVLEHCDTLNAERTSVGEKHTRDGSL